MPNSTQQAIMDSFVALLSERSMDKITVIDITKRCGVNRNTFYYHFHDIYELLDSILRIEEERLMSLASDDFSTWKESFKEGIGWCIENKNAIYSVYTSSCRDRIERYIFRAGRTSAERYVNSQIGTLDVSQRHVDILVDALGATLSGFALRWLNSGLQGNPLEEILSAAELTQGGVRAALERVAH